AVTTLGFRGEALPSIGAVSRLTLTSRARGAADAWALTVDAGTVSPPRPAPPLAGTRVEVDDLFRATPARLKFLKSTRAEADAVADAVARLAMAHPQIAFSLTADGRSVLKVPAAGALDSADTPEKVDQALTRMMLQLEELEGRFAEFDELLLRLTEKRETLYEAFEARRQHLVEARARRAESLAAAAQRILEGIAARARRVSDADALRAYFVSDPMVDKVRQIATQLQELGDTVRMDDVLSKLKTIADDSQRQLRDRHELFSGDEGQIKLGRHHFSVNRQPIELTSVCRDGQLQIHLTGTQFYQPLHDPALEQSRDLWQQILPSESEQVYRAEFLAALLYEDLQLKSQSYLKLPPAERLEFIRTAMQQRHGEGYSRGVHDRDAELLLSQLLQTEQKLGLLRYPASVRGPARFVWNQLLPAGTRQQMLTWIQGLATVAHVLPSTVASAAYTARLQRLLLKYNKGVLGRDSQDVAAAAAGYLFEQLCGGEHFVCSPRAQHLLQQIRDHLPEGERERLQQALKNNGEVPLAAWTLALDAVDGYLRGPGKASTTELDPLDNYRMEIASLLLCGEESIMLGPEVPLARRLEGLAGDHPRISAGSMNFHYHEFTSRLGEYRRQVLPRFAALREAKHRLLLQADKRLRTSEFKPKVLTSFVRNKLIDEVYLPLIGDNLAKQIGAAGDGKRSDRMGLLLLVSPPGYGKTTLMEYVANRLGLVFVKVNGPALGHAVTSLDPAESSNASAREEVQRINMALEMGDNVMLYLDDIQHCHAELLQKFIPLCDATRRIEGVWEGQPKTYDLRGRKVVVVMAGNPYTESGDRFQIPDMLANRADVYNLGEIIGDSREAFELSYIENCLTSNSYLQPLARTSSKDQRALIRAAASGSTENLDLEANLSPDQIADAIAVLSKL
ncbi:MAG: AAA family ATPase, partial [Planctomycetales bacterium]|nr:AAA family ATPase [Planctomycetales bacterium]